LPDSYKIFTELMGIAELLVFQTSQSFVFLI